MLYWIAHKLLFALSNLSGTQGGIYSIKTVKAQTKNCIKPSCKGKNALITEFYAEKGVWLISPLEDCPPDGSTQLDEPPCE